MPTGKLAGVDAYQKRNTIQYHWGFASAPALDTPHSGSLRHDARVIGVVFGMASVGLALGLVLGIAGGFVARR